jgi:GDP-L-fucose synthase
LERILLLGSEGFVGKSIDEKFKNEPNFFAMSRKDVDVLRYDLLLRKLKEIQPKIVINAIGKVGGIQRNINEPADLMLINAMTNISIVNACHELKIDRLFQFASACIYPINNDRGSLESDLGSGSIEETSKGYSQAKIFGLELYESFNKQYGYHWATLIPTNLYGIGDWHTDGGGHVIAMLTNKFLQAKLQQIDFVDVWGDGTPLRNFLNVKDLASAVKYIINREINAHSILNISGDEELSILDLAMRISKQVGFKGEIKFDSSKPNGAPRKLLDDSCMRNLGWKPSINLDEGLEEYVMGLALQAR